MSATLNITIMLRPFTNKDLKPISEAYLRMICESKEDKNRKRAIKFADQWLSEHNMLGQIKTKTAGGREIYDGEAISIHKMQDIGPEDVVLLFVFSRFYKIDIKYIKLAKERGARVYLITNEVTGPLTPYADIVLMCSSDTRSFFHSTIAADVMAEYILNLVSTRVDFKARIDEQDALTSEQRL